MQINSNPTRGIRIIDVGNATEEVALEEVRRLKEKYKGI
jgi:hypothetical protein